MPFCKAGHIDPCNTGMCFSFVPSARRTVQEAPGYAVRDPASPESHSPQRSLLWSRNKPFPDILHRQEEGR